MSTCKSCQPMPTCLGRLDRYSLQDPLYFFVLNCPPGYNCQGSRLVQIDPTDPASPGRVSIVCCDGNTYAEELPLSATAEEYDAVIQRLINECARKWAFCQEPDSQPTGVPTGGPTVPSAPPPVGPNPPENWYYSNPFSITVTCPGGGNTFTYTLPAGVFIAASQLEADSRALAEAQRQARVRRICLGPLSSPVCAGTAIAGYIYVVGPSTTYNWSVISGSVPTGMTLTSGWITGNRTSILGTPTTPGEYTFTVRCRSALGDIAERTYTICVIGLSPDTLPDGDVGTAYSQTLTAPACATGPVSFQLEAGTLPDGLTLDETTGVISGTPTVDGTFNFTISVQTEAT